MTVPGADVVLLRHGDIGVKSAHVQAAMEGHLAERVAAMLDARGVEGRVEHEWGRLFVRTDEPEGATDAVTDVFGVHTASPARAVPARMDAITDALAATARTVYDGGTFAVEARRTGDHDFTSHDVGHEGGDAIWRAVSDDVDPVVDLDDPDHRFFVEVRDEEAFVFVEKRDGPGGFPVGTQAPLETLISGGIDSPVAGWQAMRRGAPIVPLYLDLGAYGGVDHRERAFATIDTLAQYVPTQDMRPRVVQVGEYVDRLVDAIDSTRMLSYRRFMYRIAEHVADTVDAAGIVTGEALGQKSSQTVRNLNAVDRATRVPIHRPLLTRDKQEIIAAARRIGTYNDATIDAGCQRVAPDKPATRATVAAVEAAEPADLFEWAADAAASVEVVERSRTEGSS
ncbi:tRNA sulfurtransferase [Halanaeroarchaeum sulfurireducens]|uniref:Probable tRNA sulfurtransferase n=1 Tax=Halanaeroarchaeum sulfurireducens TaxID=1604004 RepID=A0A0N9NBS6_9EURY|nr:THUMP domain-containing protein [Halanaeroarchaeum sulfurireducens]ALG82457.1 tRNA sulfurtransferase [Halanaeroarchaeum sulfurireducens]